MGILHEMRAVLRQPMAAERAESLPEATTPKPIKKLRTEPDQPIRLKDRRETLKGIQNGKQ